MEKLDIKRKYAVRNSFQMLNFFFTFSSSAFKLKIFKKCANSFCFTFLWWKLFALQPFDLNFDFLITFPKYK